MKDYLINYRPFLIFLGKFFLTYLLLILIYQAFLSQYDSKKNEVDGMTQLVANQSEDILNMFNQDVAQRKMKTEPSVVIFIDSSPVVRIVEGCNAVSIMILFTAFIVAFSGKFLRTFGYIIFGIVAIHILNIFRIALLVVGMVNYPQYGDFLHGVLFPLVIYGFIFLLWVLWINKFQRYAKKNT
ncbi:exosortase family protein XrtF [Flavobacterium sp. PLA-1-15]|uniref:exosortase family protein XrtF n=1 Tax=Flavobacterium sp. PLA-1-15 TaxID=3380533 RepID=UPI003B7D2598